jgi:elongation of very long chain fatty acids protein 4
MTDVFKRIDRSIAGAFAHPLLLDRSRRIMNDWPLVNLEYMLAVCFAYVGLISFLYVAQMIINDGKPAKSIKGEKLAAKIAREGPIVVFQLIYNAVQVGLCVWMVYEALRQHQIRGLKLVCNAVDINDTGMAYVTWVFYLSKVLDFFDTVFIVARRKYEQLSFLHLYHHTTIFMVYWMNINFNYSGDIYLTIVLNGTIHAIMYFYYFVTAMNVVVPTPLKKMITRAQMLQFVIMILQASYLLYYKCPAPRNITILYLVYIISMYVLFNNFAKKYSKGTKQADIQTFVETADKSVLKAMKNLAASPKRSKSPKTKKTAAQKKRD